MFVSERLVGMKGLRILLAMLVGKFSAWFLRVFVGRGTNTPGILMQKICPDILGYFKMPPLVICVTGTNGKTSTSNMVSHMLSSAGMSVVKNSKGSNMAPGLVSALVTVSTLGGKVKRDAAVLEVAERSSQYIYKYFTPTYILCTNLFRDSIKRNGHSEFIFDKINRYIPAGTKLLLNGNDAISGRLGEGTHEQVFFAVERTPVSTDVCENNVCDIMSCPVCHKPLHFDFYHYHHIGVPRCACGFAMPEARFVAKNVDFSAGTFEFCEAEESLVLPFAAGNLFNVFNVTAVASIGRLVGLSMEVIGEGIRSFSARTGRFEAEKKGGRNVVTMLFKNQNPISGSQSMQYLNRIDGTKDVILIVTDSKDRVHGHEDISWIYDTDFEVLASPEVHKIIIGGSRCYDMGLRLHVAGVSEKKMELFESYTTMQERLQEFLAPEGTVVVFFELYAMPIANEIKKRLTQG